MPYRNIAGRAGALILGVGGLLLFFSMPQSGGVMSFLIDHPLAFFAAWMMLAGAYLLVRVRLDENARAGADEESSPHEDGAAMQIGSPMLRLCVGDGLADEFLAGDGRYSLRRIVDEVRSERAIELGIVVPKVRLQRDMTLATDAYVFEFYGEIIACGAIDLERRLLTEPAAAVDAAAGVAVISQIDGRPAKLVSGRYRATAPGETVLDPPEVFAECIRALFTVHAAKLLTRPHFEYLVEHHLRGPLQSMVDWVGTTALPYSLCHAVYIRLLEEQLWPRYPVELFTRFIAASKNELLLGDAREYAPSDVGVLYGIARKIIVPRELARRKVDVDTFRTLPASVRVQILSAWSAQLRSFSDIPVALPAGAVPAAIVVPPEEREIIALFFKSHATKVDVYAFDELPSHASHDLPSATVRDAVDPLENARLSQFFA